MSKKIIIAVLAVISATAFLVFGGCKKEDANISLNQTEITLVAEGKATLEATVTGSEDAVVWSSSDPAVATVKDGVVTALAAGQTDISATIGDVSAVCRVTVTSDFPVMVVTPQNMSVIPGGTGQIVASVSLGNQNLETEFTFTSADENVATVSAAGNVSAVGKGSTQITVSAVVYGLEITKTVSVTVEDYVEIRTNVDKISLSALALSADDKQSETVTASLYVNDEKQDGAIDVSYSSENEEVFTVSEEGVVTAVGVGTANLTISSEFDGKPVEKTVPVTVVKTVVNEFTAEVSFEDTMYTKSAAGANTEQTMSVTVEPYATGLNIDWKIKEGVGELMQDAEDPLSAVYKVPQDDYYGGEVAVVVSVEGMEVATAVISIYVPISTETELVDINNHLDGWFMLTNDIKMQNNVAGNINRTGDNPLTTDVVEEPTPLTAEFDDINGNKVWAYNHAVITQRTKLTTGTEEWNGSFEGIFDGNGYTISDLRVYYLHFDGLFGYNTGIIRNVNVEIEAWQSSTGHWRSIRNQGAGIVADNSGVVENCTAKCVLISTANASNATAGGGIVGRLLPGGVVKDCYAEVTWRTVLDDNQPATYSPMGGIVGMVMADESVGQTYTIENCWYKYVADPVHDVDGSGEQYVNLAGTNASIEGTASGKYQYETIMFAGEQQTLSLSISVQSVAWSIVSGGGTLVPDEENIGKAVYTASENGGKVVVQALIEDKYTVVFEFSVYTPITTEAELYAINDNLSGWYLLMNDIVMQNNTEGASVATTVGGESVYAYNKAVINSGNFAGVFDGNGFTISELRFIYTANNDMGLFSSTAATAIVRNLAVKVDTWHTDDNKNQIFRNRSGAIVGFNRGLIENCYAELIAMGSQNEWVPCGGISGYVSGTGKVINCYTKVDWCDVLTNGGGIVAGMGAIIGHVDAGAVVQNCWYSLQSETNRAKIKMIYDNATAITAENCGEISADGTATEGFSPDSFDGGIWNITLNEEGKIMNFALNDNCTYSAE